MNLFRDKQFGLKVEATAGKKETLSVSDYGLQLTDLTGTADVQAIDANVFRGSISSTASRIGKKTATFELGGELKNSGVLNTLPKIDTILTASRFSRDVVKVMTVSSVVGTTVALKTIITGGTSTATGLVVAIEGTKLYFVSLSGTFSNAETITATGGFSATVASVATAHGYLYRPSSTIASEKCVTVNVFDGGYQKNAFGCAGTFTMSLSTESYPSWTSTLSGVVNPAEWGVEGTKVSNVVYEDHLPSIVHSAQMSIGGAYTPVTSNIELDLGNNVVVIPDLNSENWLKYAVVTARAATATITALAEPDSDVYEKLFAGETATLTFKIGTGAGNQINVICPNIQYQSIAESDQDSFLAQQINCKLTGDDKELAIWFR